MDILLFNTLLFVTCGYALAQGGGPERAAALILFSSALITFALNVFTSLKFETLEIGVFAIDVILLLCLIALSLFADRYWTLWISAFHAFAVAVHFVRLTNPHLLPFVYLVAAGLMSVPMQFALAWATWRHQKRKRANGTDNSWSEYSPTWIRLLPLIGQAD